MKLFEKKEKKQGYFITEEEMKMLKDALCDIRENINTDIIVCKTMASVIDNDFNGNAKLITDNNYRQEKNMSIYHNVRNAIEILQKLCE